MHFRHRQTDRQTDIYHKREMYILHLVLKIKVKNQIKSNVNLITVDRPQPGTRKVWRRKPIIGAITQWDPREASPPNLENRTELWDHVYLVPSNFSAMVAPMNIILAKLLTARGSHS